MLKLYNTLTRKIEEFRPINPPQVGMYTCGMTVYDHTHLGHMRTYVNTDILRRTLEYNGFIVKQVENVTDVGHLTSDSDTGEDKLAKKAREERKTAWEIAKIYTQEFYEVMAELNVLPPQIIAKATEHIKEMIALVKRLEEKGFTYIIPGDGVYFETKKLPDYGKLTNMPRNKILAGARVKVIPGKKNPTDFALWKFTPKGVKRDMEWDSPWGVGFPGWHIECSAMSMKYLGESFDLHTGGIDHILIHHTNEMAQSEAASGKPFVRYWFHNEHMLVEGKKMSKSLGNYFWIEDVKKRGFAPLALRYLFLTSHYRDKLNFSWQALAAAQKALDNLYSIVANLRQDKPRTISVEKLKKVDQYREKFKQVLNNDLAAPSALALTWQVVKSNIPSPDKLDLLLDFDQVLGLKLSEVPSPKRFQVPSDVQKLVEEREKLRQEGKWQAADKLRKEVKKAGFIVEDTVQGPKVKPK